MKTLQQGFDQYHNMYFPHWAHEHAFPHYSLPWQNFFFPPLNRNTSSDLEEAQTEYSFSIHTSID